MDVVFSTHHRKHATRTDTPGCPAPYLETPDRADAIITALSAARIATFVEPLDHGIEVIRLVHGREFLGYLQSAYSGSRELFGVNPSVEDTYAARGWRHRPSGLPGSIGYYSFDTSCPVYAGTWLAAYWSAQCAATAATRVHGGSRAVYALCRPPGHHAGRELYGGYCYLNNAAVAARVLQKRQGTRVAILDIDYHHGNGTQEIFYRDPSVCYCSIHADPDREKSAAMPLHFWRHSNPELNLLKETR